MNPEDAAAPAERMIALADNRHLADFAVVSIRMEELRALVYMLRYTQSQRDSAMLSLAECYDQTDYKR